MGAVLSDLLCKDEVPCLLCKSCRSLCGALLRHPWAFPLPQILSRRRGEEQGREGRKAVEERKSPLQVRTEDIAKVGLLVAYNLSLELDEPAADLATVLAVASSFLDRPLGIDLAAIGEVGLSGELRSVNAMNQRLSEISRLGFERCVVPRQDGIELQVPKTLKLIPACSIGEAIAPVLGGKKICQQ